MEFSGSDKPSPATRERRPLVYRSRSSTRPDVELPSPTHSASSGSSQGSRSSNDSSAWTSKTSLPTSPSEPSDENLGTASSLWTRVAAAAGNISINVAKAWEQGIFQDEEEPRTPPGQESRLTIAMKQYYIQRVDDVQDLPAWLFSDRERQIKRDREIEFTTQDAIDPFRDSRNADVSSAFSRGQHRQMSGSDVHLSRATTKLRAMADAKRGIKRGDYSDTTCSSRITGESSV
ncbi:hypothetical protein FRB99_007874 [Tulasnella sp. 403]|nr:hypothetical protein FRB99_007874 [Tulasnella sp. 403]